jgi:hypothetical protein
MLRHENFKLLIQEIPYEMDILSGKLKTISIDKVMDMMGFPMNYKNILRTDV